MKASPGTNWWDAVFTENAPIYEANVDVSGGSDKGRYFFSTNYFSQDGIMRYTDYKKYSIRANTEFKVKGFTFGENMSVTFDNYVGQPGGNQVEQNMVNEGLLKMQPIIPVYDEGGNWGGTKAGFGNGKNGRAQLYRNKDNRGEGTRIIGNVFGEVQIPASLYRPALCMALTRVGILVKTIVLAMWNPTKLPVRIFQNSSTGIQTGYSHSRLLMITSLVITMYGLQAYTKQSSINSET